MTQPTQQKGKLLKVLVWGTASIMMYATLLIYEQQILKWSTKGHWFFVFPIMIAFAFSFVHGNFTGEFWRSLGIRAKKSSSTQ